MQCSCSVLGNSFARSSGALPPGMTAAPLLEPLNARMHAFVRKILWSISIEEVAEAVSVPTANERQRSMPVFVLNDLPCDELARRATSSSKRRCVQS